jgi:two-component system response regulator HydG
MILVGAPGGEFRRAAELARDAGAAVAMADTPAQRSICCAKAAATW